MKSNNEVSYLQVLYTLAWADGEIQEEELMLISEVETQLALDTDSRAFLEQWRERQRSLDDLNSIDFSEWSTEQKKHVYFVATQVAKADGIATKKETDFLEHFARLLGFDRASEADLITAIIEDMHLFGEI